MQKIIFLIVEDTNLGQKYFTGSLSKFNLKITLLHP
jgi:hypothetical protein